MEQEGTEKLGSYVLKWQLQMHCKRLLFKINNSVNAVVQPLVNAHCLLFVDLCTVLRI